MVVIGLPETLKPPPLVIPSITVPTSRFELNNSNLYWIIYLFWLHLLGIESVIFPLLVIGLFETPTSVPDSSVFKPTLVTEPRQFENGKSDKEMRITSSDEFSLSIKQSLVDGVEPVQSVAPVIILSPEQSTDILPEVVTVPVRPVPPETLVTVPVQVVLELNMTNPLMIMHLF